MPPPRSRFHHVANGTCTTRLIEAAGIPGTWSIWADPLYEGPVRGGLTDEELIDERARYLAGPKLLPAGLAWGPPSGGPPVNDLRLWRAAIERHDAYDELVLWFEHDLFDQLNLIQLLTWIRDRLPAAKPVSLICIGSFPGYPRFKGLGELSPEELAPLLETRQLIAEPQVSLAARAWQAFREPTPEALDDLRHQDTAALPYLAPAMFRFLQEYPWTTDGLSRTERRLLELAGGGVDLSAAFPRMHDEEDVYYVTDSSLAALAEGLSRTSPPLLARAPGRRDEDRLLQGPVAITNTGRAVLAQQRDKVTSCGIDRWLGGVHLHGDGGVWRWDPARQSVTRR